MLQLPGPRHDSEIWMFPKIVVPPNHPFRGTPIFGNTHIQPQLSNCFGCFINHWKMLGMWIVAKPFCWSSRILLRIRRWIQFDEKISGMIEISLQPLTVDSKVGGFLLPRKVALSLMIMEVSLDTWCWTQMCFPIKVTGSVWIEPNKRLWWDYFDHVYVQLKDARYAFGLWTQTRNLTVLAVFCGEPFDGSSQIYKSCDKIAKMALNILGGGGP